MKYVLNYIVLRSVLFFILIAAIVRLNVYKIVGEVWKYLSFN